MAWLLEKLSNRMAIALGVLALGGFALLLPAMAVAEPVAPAEAPAAAEPAAPADEAAPPEAATPPAEDPAPAEQPPPAEEAAPPEAATPPQDSAPAEPVTPPESGAPPETTPPPVEEQPVVPPPAPPAGDVPPPAVEQPPAAELPPVAEEQPAPALPPGSEVVPTPTSPPPSLPVAPDAPRLGDAWRTEPAALPPPDRIATTVPGMPDTAKTAAVVGGVAPDAPAATLTAKADSPVAPTPPAARKAGATEADLAGSGFAPALGALEPRRAAQAAPVTARPDAPSPAELAGDGEGRNPFATSVGMPGGPLPAGSSLLSVLASYVLPGGGSLPASTLFLFVQLAVILLACFAPRPGAFERLVASGLLGARAGHRLAVARPG